ncbi:MAG: hypothetical protein AAF741_10095 [Bacteroidota bacterium]
METPDFIDFKVIDLPELGESLKYLAKRGIEIEASTSSKQLLVLYKEGSGEGFLHDILKACGYAEPSEEAWLIPWPAEQALDLTAMVRHLACDKVMLFGQQLPNLGLHLNLGHYSSVKISDVWYVKADDLDTIRDEKNAGKTQKAAALWQALKTHFKRE